MPKKNKNKRWMKAIGGYSSWKSFALFVFGVGLLAFAGALVYFARERNVAFTPLPSMSHTTSAPDTGELLRLINDKRRENDKGELASDDRLKAVAEQRLKDMVENQRYSHKDSSGKFYYDYLSEQKYQAEYSCENLGIEYVSQPRKFIQSWMTSTGGHKECLLNDKVSNAGIASGKFSEVGGPDNLRNAYLVVVILGSEAK